MKITDKSPANYPAGASATGWPFLLAPLAFLGGPPLYDSDFDLRCALASSLRSTIVPEVFDSSVQPLSQRCEPMNRQRNARRSRRKRIVIMAITLMGEVERDRPRGF